MYHRRFWRSPIIGAGPLITIYHNPACSKSRAALELLRARGIKPSIVHYLDTPPDEAALRDLLGLLGLPAIGLARKGEPVAAELGITSMDENTLIATLLQYPVLIERPIVVNGNRAVIGRPPERVLDIL